MYQLAPGLRGLWLLLGSGNIAVGAVNYGGQIEPSMYIVTLLFHSPDSNLYPQLRRKYPMPFSHLGQGTGKVVKISRIERSVSKGL
jgi:hypothetical protein